MRNFLLPELQFSPTISTSLFLGLWFNNDQLDVDWDLLFCLMVLFSFLTCR